MINNNIKDKLSGKNVEEANTLIHNILDDLLKIENCSQLLKKVDYIRKKESKFPNPIKTVKEHTESFCLPSWGNYSPVIICTMISSMLSLSFNKTWIIIIAAIIGSIIGCIITNIYLSQKNVPKTLKNETINQCEPEEYCEIANSIISEYQELSYFEKSMIKNSENKILNQKLLSQIQSLLGYINEESNIDPYLIGIVNSIRDQFADIDVKIVDYTEQMSDYFEISYTEEQSEQKQTYPAILFHDKVICKGRVYLNK